MDTASQPAAMSTETRVAWAPIAVWLVTAALLFGSMVVSLGRTDADGDGSALVFVLLVVLMVGSFATVGALLAARRPRNPIGWLFVLAGLLLAVALMSQALTTRIYDSGASLSSEFLVPLQVASVLFQPGLVSAALVVLVFPDGRVPRWGRAVLIVVLVGAVLVTASQLLMPGPIVGQVAADNPLGLRGHEALLTTAAGVGNALLVVGLAVATILLAARYRRADEIQRKQLEWFAYIAIVLALSLAVASLEIAPVSDVAWIVVFGAFAALPIAIAIAVMRYRLYDIDALINRTLVYVPLLALLAGLFAAGITFFERLFLALTGDESDIAIVLSTLIVAMAFDPLRMKLEQLVDRWFKPAGATVGAVALVNRPSIAIGDDPALEAYIESVVSRVLEEKR